MVSCSMLFAWDLASMKLMGFENWSKDNMLSKSDLLKIQLKLVSSYKTTCQIL